jgi:hypothetical protein
VNASNAAGVDGSFRLLNSTHRLSMQLPIMAITPLKLILPC